MEGDNPRDFFRKQLVRFRDDPSVTTMERAAATALIEMMAWIDNHFDVWKHGADDLRVPGDKRVKIVTKK